MRQIQCPNCGGFKVQSELLFREVESNRVTKPPSGCVAYAISIIIIGLAVLCMPVIATYREYAHTFWEPVPTVPPGLEAYYPKPIGRTPGTIYYAGSVGIGLAIIIGVGIVVGTRRWIKKWHTRPRREHYQFECDLCGYQWAWEPSDE